MIGELTALTGDRPNLLAAEALQRGKRQAAQQQHETAATDRHGEKGGGVAWRDEAADTEVAEPS